MHLPSLLGLVAATLASGCWGPAVDPSPECAGYVRCIEAIDLAATPPQETDLVRYQVGGACWGNHVLGDGCTTSCRRALDRIRPRQPAPPAECAP
jgi:hypothetical protein